MQSDPTTEVIARFRAALETVQAAELNRLYIRLPKLTDSSREEIRQFSNRLVASFLEQPLKSLGEGTSSNSPQPLLESFEQLFRLSSDSETASVTVS
jgi:glutamyl-tRNA reductase